MAPQVGLEPTTLRLTAATPGLRATQGAGPGMCDLQLSRTINSVSSLSTDPSRRIDLLRFATCFDAWGYKFERGRQDSFLTSAC